MRLLLTALFTVSLSGVANANNDALITQDAHYRCIQSDSLPDHKTGKFPNRGNPHAIKAQRVKMCVPLKPTKTNKAQYIKGTTGIAINGIQFRPNTAGAWNPNARNGHSHHGGDKRWTLDIYGAKGHLGLDNNNAHVGPNGLYHYHGIASGLLKSPDQSLIGYAGDGFEMHYIGAKAVSGYVLKRGVRPSGPKGEYDGTYNEDYEYEGGVGRLDECNGGQLNGRYVYFVTDSYPFVGRCLWGDIADGFGEDRH